MGFRLTTCCGVASLKTGCLIVGIIDAISKLAYVISTSVFASQMTYENNPELEESKVDLLYGTYVALAIISSIQLCVTLIFLAGVFTEKPNLMKPWLFFAAIDMIMIVFALVINCIMIFFSSASIITTITSSSLSIILKIYFSLVIYSYYSYLTERSTLNQMARRSA